jgi:hypothetical protein
MTKGAPDKCQAEVYAEVCRLCDLRDRLWAEAADRSRRPGLPWFDVHLEVLVLSGEWRGAAREHKRAEAHP